MITEETSLTNEQRTCLLDRAHELAQHIQYLKSQPFSQKNTKQRLALEQEYKELADKITQERFVLGELLVKRTVIFTFQNNQTLPENTKSFYYGTAKKAYRAVWKDGVPHSIEGWELSDITRQPARVEYRLRIVDEFEPTRIKPHAKTPGVKFPDLKPIDYRKNAELLLQGKEPLDPNQQAEAEATEKPKDKLSMKLAQFFNRKEDPK